jgi:hypothetical protein
MGIFDIFSNSDAQNAAQAQAAGLTAGYNQLVPLLNQGTGALQTNYAAALQPSQQQFATGQQGQNQLANLLGLNGANGSATAQNTLQNLPGYQFALNQGAQNVMRNQASTGQLNSGATNLDLQAQGQGLASQNYNSYVSQLQPFMGTANTNAGNIGNLYSGLGQGINQNYNTQGAAAYGTQAGIGNAQAQADYANLAQSGAIFGGLTSLAGNVLGAGLKPGGFLGSEPRFKEDITLDGYHDSGLPIYRYRYKGGKKRYYGVMAPDLQKFRPDAVRGKPGFRNVNRAVVSQILREYHGSRSGMGSGCCPIDGRNRQRR